MLRAGGCTYPVNIRRGQIHAFLVHGDTAAAAWDMDTEILGMEETAGGLCLRVQGQPGGLVTVYRDNTETSVTLSRAGVSHLLI